MPNTKLTSLSLLLLLGFIWGTGYSIARFAMTNGVSPLGYSFWQAIGPAILIGLINLFRQQRLTFSKIHLRYYLICGLTGIVIPNTNMYFSAPHLPAGLLAVIVNTVPIVAYPMALLAGVERFQKFRLLGICSAMVGILLIILQKPGFLPYTPFPWVLTSLITPCSFAFCAVYIARFRPKNSDSLSLAAGTLIASSILLVPIVVFSGNFYSFHTPLTSPDLVILLEIILSSIGYVLFFQLIKVAGPVYYSMVDTIVSLTGLFWGYLIFHEKLNLSISLAVLLIILGLILVTQYQRRSQTG
jgi:drug/metabolite transporter (DMT)-like permease